MEEIFIPSHSGAWEGPEGLQVGEGVAITPFTDIQGIGDIYSCFLATSKGRAFSEPKLSSAAASDVLEGPRFPFLLK